jgi:hypothetical protein
VVQPKRIRYQIIGFFTSFLFDLDSEMTLYFGHLVHMTHLISWHGTLLVLIQLDKAQIDKLQFVNSMHSSYITKSYLVLRHEYMYKSFLKCSDKY